MGMLDFIAGRDLASVTPLKRQEPPSFSVERGIVASAEKIDLKKPETTAGVLTTNRPWSEWQAEAWEYYDAIGEIKYAFGLLGAVMSRIRIYAAVNIDPDAVPASTISIRRRKAGQSPEETETDVRDKMSIPDDVTDEVMDYMEQLIRDLASGRGGMPGLLRSFALNIAVAGETYLTKIDGRWQFRSTEEIRIRDADRVALLRTMRSLVSTSAGVMGERELPEGTYIGRIWRAHPRYSGEPDSSMLGLREMCDELLTLQRMVRALARSKMNAGGVFVPDSITAGGSSAGEEMVDEEAEADAFEQEFNQAMIVPATDETSAGTVSPFLMRGPAEDGDKIKYITFDRKTDRELVERLDRALERILQGIDIPKDVVTGLANVKYSNAINIDESLYKAHVEPMALLLVDSLTSIFMIPALKAKFPDLSDESLEKIVVWYDPTEVVTKPDPADAAARLHEKWAISDDALRRAHGFSDTDAPDQDEIAARMAKGQAALPPDILASLIKFLLPDVFKKAQEANVASSSTPMPDSARQLLGMGGGDGSGADQGTPDASGAEAPPADASGGAAQEGPAAPGADGGASPDTTGGF